MTAPHTNVERDAKRHSPALTGITIALVAAALAFVVFTLWPNPEDATPSPAAVQDSAAQVEGTTPAPTPAPGQ